MSRAAWLAVLLIVGSCGGENGGAERPAIEIHSPNDPQHPIAVLPQSGLPPMGDLVDQLLETQEPTAELVADLRGGRDPRVISLVNNLRFKILSNENAGWNAGKLGFWRDRRCCSAEALRLQRGVEVEIHCLRLPPKIASEFGADSNFSPLRVSRSKCIRVAAEGGFMRGSYGPIVLRLGETARLMAGWTRARLGTRVKDGHQYDEHCHDVFTGLRVAVTAHAAAGSSGTWELGVFASSGGLRNEVAVLARDPDWYGQDDITSNSALLAEDNRLRMTREQGCWLGRVKGSYEDSDTQILVCARLVDME